MTSFLVDFSELNALTSFFFGFVSMKGSMMSHWMGPTFLWLMGISIMNHMKSTPVFLSKFYIRWIDRIYAHLITVMCIYESLHLPFSYNLCMFWIYLLYIVYIYHLSNRSSRPHMQGVFWHGTVHLGSSLGCLHLLSAQQKYIESIRNGS